ncbi:DUF6328 family protein [Streptomyces sp. NPDC058657]|uniref:DUF6328 family protein n=1 Tax=unclassified Streptomyces TaxID=2593676 RepID=UPI0036662618
MAETDTGAGAANESGSPQGRADHGRTDTGGTRERTGEGQAVDGRACGREARGGRPDGGGAGHRPVSNESGGGDGNGSGDGNGDRGRNGRSGGRSETEDERADRQWGELVQEIRVAQTGVQILFGFLLTVVFQPGFQRLGETDKMIYVITVVLGATATGALIGPVSFHRIVSGRKIKPQAVVWASRLTFLGLLLLLATLSSALLLVMRAVTHNAYAPWLVAGVVTWYLLCWYVLPVWARKRHTSD